MLSMRIFDWMLLGFISLVLVVAYIVKPSQSLVSSAKESKPNAQVRYRHPSFSDNGSAYDASKDDIIRNLAASLELERLKNVALENEVKSIQYLFEEIFIVSRSKILAGMPTIEKEPYILALLGDSSDKSEPRLEPENNSPQEAKQHRGPVARPVMRPAQSFADTESLRSQEKPVAKVAQVESNQDTKPSTIDNNVERRTGKVNHVVEKDIGLSDKIKQILGRFDYEPTEKGFLVVVPGKKLFSGNSREIAPDAQDLLQPIAAVAQQDRGLRIEIAGHTDGLASVEESRAISKRRADSVRDFLVEKLSIDSQRIDTAGKGKRFPIASNATLDGRQANRRIEIQFLKN